MNKTYDDSFEEIGKDNDFAPPMENKKAYKHGHGHYPRKDVVFVGE